jgi:hypothetical protein
MSALIWFMGNFPEENDAGKDSLSLYSQEMKNPVRLDVPALARVGNELPFLSCALGFLRFSCVCPVSQRGPKMGNLGNFPSTFLWSNPPFQKHEQCSILQKMKFSVLPSKFLRSPDQSYPVMFRWYLYIRRNKGKLCSLIGPRRPLLSSIGC